MATTRISTLYVEAIAASVPTLRISTMYVEAITNLFIPPTNRVSTFYVEAIADVNPIYLPPPQLRVMMLA